MGWRVLWRRRWRVWEKNVGFCKWESTLFKLVLFVTISFEDKDKLLLPFVKLFWTKGWVSLFEEKMGFWAHGSNLRQICYFVVRLLAYSNFCILLIFKFYVGLFILKTHVFFRVVLHCSWVFCVEHFDLYIIIWCL